jgi:hypothetical protein
MGYELHITRAEFWADNDNNQITVDEWLKFVAADPELKLAGYNGPHFALWSGRSKSPEPWLDWSQGNVYSKNPDKAIVSKMLQIAQALGARVQGDDGEFYEDTSEIPE